MLLVAAFLAAPAAGDIYWANEGTSTIGKAEGDGTSPNNSFISGADVATTAHAVAVDATYVYWAHDGVAGDAPAGNVGRAPLANPAAPQATFITTTDSPKGLTLDQAGISWTQAPGGTGAIGRATLGGFLISQSHVPNIGASPCGLTTDFDKFFWALGGSPGSIMKAHGTFPPFSTFSPMGTTDNPCGVALANGIVYWTNRGTGTIGRADLTGTTVGTPISTGLATDAPCGVAVDGAHIYWTEQDTDTINRSNLDGSSVNPAPFPISVPAADPCGIAVDPTAAAEPSQQTFADTAVGSRSDTATLVLRNTSSSILDPSGVSIVGANPGDFELSGDGCTVNVVSAGQICVLNVTFAPGQTGSREAALRVASNAGDSPTDFSLAGTATTPQSTETPPAEPPTMPVEVERTLSISYSRRGNRFKGRLSSDRGECVQGHEVVVQKRRRGNDARVGADLTNDAGRWAVTEADAEGRFYATAKQSALPAGDSCLAAGSETIKVG